jgi:N-acetylmuramic acid 6-phosphate etherase
LQDNKKLYKQLALLATEQLNPSSRNLDSLSIEGILRLINKQDINVPKMVYKELKYITRSVDLIVGAMKSGGRLIYIGAGTSGRLGVLDAAEIPPTYGTEPELVQAIIAGGNKAVFRSQEGSEDKHNEAVESLKKLNLNKRDIVCGIAASFRTPFVAAGFEYAKIVGAKTIMITTNPRTVLKEKNFSALRKNIDIAICPDVGPEVIMGSTRMKSGTAQKLVLNMLTTVTMIRLGKIYGNMMVDLKMNSKKLEERAKRVLMNVTGIDYNKAEEMLKKADGHVKTAIVMIIKHTEKRKAQLLLKKANGFVRDAIK